MNMLVSVALLVFAGFFQVGDAAITKWTTPTIASAADGTGTLTVSESQALDSTITTYVAVTDASSITYALNPAAVPFALSTDGVLTITATNLDADTPATYTLNIVATDDGSGSGVTSGTAVITVTVTDVDEAPAFGATSYSKCMADGSDAGTAVFTVLATDADPGDSITHSINSGDPNNDFAIDGDTGAITVAGSKTLSTTTASYTLVIHAVDNETPTAQTGSTTVTVTVSATCSSATALDTTITGWSTPDITGADGTGTLTVQESQAINTAMETYVATTSETPVTYALTPAVSPFALSTAGVLTITANLMARTTSSYTLIIVATGNGGGIGTATITVTVTAAPAFSANSYSQCMTDGSVADTAVITVLAADPDTGSSITHSIHSGDPNNDFAIDGDTGAITVAGSKTLSTTTASYTLVIHAVDDESPPQTGSTTVVVSVSTTCSSAVAVGISITAILTIMLVSML